MMSKIEYATRVLRYALNNAEEESELEYDDISSQTSFKVGWLKNAIRTALEELESIDPMTEEKIRTNCLETYCEWIKRHSAHIESFGDRLYGINLEHFVEAMEE